MRIMMRNEKELKKKRASDASDICSFPFAFNYRRRLLRTCVTAGLLEVGWLPGLV